MVMDSRTEEDLGTVNTDMVFEFTQPLPPPEINSDI